MTNSTYFGAVKLLEQPPSREEAEQFAQRYSTLYFKGKPCTIALSATLPEGLSADVAHQLSTSRQALSEDAVFLLVKPAEKEASPWPSPSLRP